MRAQVTTSLAMLLLAFINPHGTLGAPVQLPPGIPQANFAIPKGSHILRSLGENQIISPDSNESPKGNELSYTTKDENRSKKCPINDCYIKTKQSDDTNAFQNSLHEAQQENENDDITNLEDPIFFHVGEKPVEASKTEDDDITNLEDPIFFHVGEKPVETYKTKNAKKRDELVAQYESPASGDPYEPVSKRPMQYLLMSNAYFGSHGMSGTDNNLRTAGRQRFSNYKQLAGSVLD